MPFSHYGTLQGTWWINWAIANIQAGSNAYEAPYR